jgi:hypothetical protein
MYRSESDLQPESPAAASTTGTTSRARLLHSVERIDPSPGKASRRLEAASDVSGPRHHPRNLATLHHDLGLANLFHASLAIHGLGLLGEHPFAREGAAIQAAGLLAVPDSGSHTPLLLAPLAAAFA